MKKDNTVFRQRRRVGMTLLEVVVFMTLALFVLGGSFPLISRLLYSDRAHEERLAAYNFAQSISEDLRSKLATTGYDSVVDGYPFNGSFYDRRISNTNFYKNVEMKSLRVRLFPKTDNKIGDFYKVFIDMKWKTHLRAGKTDLETDRLVLILPRELSP